MRNNNCFKTVLVLMTILITATPAKAGKPLVYIVHSYEHNHVCGQPQADGIIDMLVKNALYPAQVDVRSFYMDTKKTHTTPEAIIEQGRIAMQLIDDLNPAVVVTLDDNAFRQVGMKLIDRKGVSVVFSGMNGQPESYHAEIPFMESREAPGHNVTGVYEKLHLKRALSVMATTLRNMQKVVGITDYSPTGNAITRQFEIESASMLPSAWEVRRVHSFDEYKELIRELNNTPDVQAIYPVALTLDDNGTRVTAPEIFRWTIEHSTKPEIPLNYFFCQLGLFGGASVDFGEMGRLAGIQVSAILQGAAAGDLPIVEAADYAIVFNTERAAMLGITIPEDLLLTSDTVFKKATLLH